MNGNPQESQIRNAITDFQALTERVERLERHFRDMDIIAEIMRKAHIPDPVLEVAEQEIARRDRHLKAVK
jgi:hypothetical protein